MAFARASLQSSAQLAAAGTRCFSAASARCRPTGAFVAAKRSTADLLDVLSPSTASRRHPSEPQRKPATNPSPITWALKDFSPSKTAAAEMVESEQRALFARQIYRRWQPGDVYTPHDLSGSEQLKWKRARKTAQSDAFDTLGINPVNEYKNFTMMSEYMTEMGRIKHSSETGLRPKNQRKIAKAIRRAIGLGLMPSVHRHPLVLKRSSPGRFL